MAKQWDVWVSMARTGLEHDWLLVATDEEIQAVRDDLSVSRYVEDWGISESNGPLTVQDFWEEFYPWVENEIG